MATENSVNIRCLVKFSLRDIRIPDFISNSRRTSMIPATILDLRIWAEQNFVSNILKPKGHQGVPQNSKRFRRCTKKIGLGGKITPSNCSRRTWLWLTWLNALAMSRHALAAPLWIFSNLLCPVLVVKLRSALCPWLHSRRWSYRSIASLDGLSLSVHAHTRSLLSKDIFHFPFCKCVQSISVFFAGSCWWHLVVIPVCCGSPHFWLCLFLSLLLSFSGMPSRRLSVCSVVSPSKSTSQSCTATHSIPEFGVLAYYIAWPNLT